MKKQGLWLLSLAAIVSVLAAACGPTPAPAATTPPAAVAGAEPSASPPGPQAKILRLRLTEDIQNLDPAFQISESDTMVANAVMSGLVRYCPNSYDICNDLAESIEQSDDGLVISFKLKEGVRWQQGYGEVTTEDVKFSFERLIDPELAAAYADDWATLDHVEIIDKYNGQIILKEPFAPLWHTILPGRSGTIVCEKCVEEMGLDPFAMAPVGSGPYIFSEWKPQEAVILTRNPRYFGPRPYWDEIQFIPIEDDEAAEAALEAGELDWSRIGIGSVERFDASPDFQVWKEPSLHSKWIAMNLASPKLKNINVRWAILYAADVPGILAAAYQNQADQEYALIPPGLVGYWPDAPHYDRDVDAARDYMDAADLTTLDLRLDLEDTVEYRAWAEILQQNLKEIGINLTLNPMSSGVYWSASFGTDAAKNNELLAGDYALDPDPASATKWFTCAQVGAWNAQNWCNKQYDELYQEGLVTLEDWQREQIYIEMQQLWDEAVQTIWITHGVETYAYTPRIVPATTPNGQPQYNYFQPAP